MICAAALEARLLDFEDRVRTEAVTVICDIAMSNANFVVHKIFAESTERLRDKSVRLILQVLEFYCPDVNDGFLNADFR